MLPISFPAGLATTSVPHSLLSARRHIKNQFARKKSRAGLHHTSRPQYKYLQTAISIFWRLADSRVSQVRTTQAWCGSDYPRSTLANFSFFVFP
jgi:hypothetical protein